MNKNIMGIIGAAQTDVLERCRKRLEDAAKKAREEGAITCDPEYGITSVLKRKHNL
jgi:hypothetical protein